MYLGSLEHSPGNKALLAENIGSFVNNPINVYGHIRACKKTVWLSTQNQVLIVCKLE